MLRARLAAFAAAVSTVLLGLTALTAAPASAAPNPGEQWVHDQMQQQLHRKPGGTVNGNELIYAADHVTLTYYPPAAPGSATPMNYAGCLDGNVCLFNSTSPGAGNLRLSTSSLWCPWENTNGWLGLSQYGLSGNVHSADSENGWWTAGIWGNWTGAWGIKWEMAPQGILYNTDPNVQYLEVCINHGDL